MSPRIVTGWNWWRHQFLTTGRVCYQLSRHRARSLARPLRLPGRIRDGLNCLARLAGTVWKGESFRAPTLQRGSLGLSYDVLQIGCDIKCRRKYEFRNYQMKTKVSWTFKAPRETCVLDSKLSRALFIWSVQRIYRRLTSFGKSELTDELGGDFIFWRECNLLCLGRLVILRVKLWRYALLIMVLLLVPFFFVCVLNTQPS